MITDVLSTLNKTLFTIFIFIGFHSYAQVVSNLEIEDSVQVKGRLDYTFNDDEKQFIICKKSSGFGYVIQEFNKKTNKIENELSTGVNTTYNINWPKFYNHDKTITILGLKNNQRAKSASLTRVAINKSTLSKSYSEIVNVFYGKGAEYNPYFSISENGDFLVVLEDSLKEKYFSFYHKGELLEKKNASVLFPNLDKKCRHSDKPAIAISNIGRVFISSSVTCRRSKFQYSELASLSFDDLSDVKWYKWNLPENAFIGSPFRFEIDNPNQKILAYSKVSAQKTNDAFTSHFIDNNRTLGFCFIELNNETGEVETENFIEIIRNGRPIDELSDLKSHSLFSGNVNVHSFSKTEDGFIFQVSSYITPTDYPKDRMNGVEHQEHLFRTMNGKLIASAHIKSDYYPVNLKLNEEQDGFFLFYSNNSVKFGVQYCNKYNILNEDKVVILQFIPLNKIGINYSNSLPAPYAILRGSIAKNKIEVYNFSDSVAESVLKFYTKKKHTLYFFKLTRN